MKRLSAMKFVATSTCREGWGGVATQGLCLLVASLCAFVRSTASHVSGAEACYGPRVHGVATAAAHHRGVDEGLLLKRLLNRLPLLQLCSYYERTIA